MFMLYSLALGLIVGLLAGGRVGRLADIRFELVWLAVAALIVQLILFTEPVTTAVGSLGPPVYVVSTAIVLVVVMRNIPKAPGLAIVALGTCSNLAAIIANGGYMPVSLEALGIAEPVVTTHFANSVLTAQPALELLIDRFALPSWLPFWNVFSIGDVLIAVGIVVVMVVGMRGRQPRSDTARPTGGRVVVTPPGSTGVRHMP